MGPVAQLITVTLFVVAVARSVILIKDDEVFAFLRRLLVRLPGGKTLVRCPWCLSIWAGLLVWGPMYATWAQPWPMPWPAWWLLSTMAFSYGSVILINAERMLKFKLTLMAMLAASPDQPPDDGR